MTLPRFFALPLAALLGATLFIISMGNVQAKPKRQYRSCSYQSKNVIKKPKVQTFTDLKSCTVRNAARQQMASLNYLYKTVFIPSYKKNFNTEIRKQMRKNPKKRAALRRMQIRRISLHASLVSVKGKVISRRKKKCKVRITQLVMKLKSCGIMKK